MDLPARLLHPGHVVGHPRRVLDVLRIHQIAVGPIRRVEVPADPLDPDGAVGDALGRLLGGDDHGHRAVGDRRDVEPLHRPGQHLARQHVVDRDVGLPEEGGRMPGRVPLVLHRHRRDVALVQSVCRHVAVHLQGEDPQEIRAERPLEDVVEDRQERALWVRLAGGHLLFGDAEHDVGLSRCDRVPALDRGEHTAPAAHVGSDERFVPRASAVGQVIPLAMHAVEGVGRAGQADGVDLIQLHPGGVQGRTRGLERELLAGLLGAPDEAGHARAHDRDAATRHADLRTATAALVLGTPRQDWTTAARPSPARSRSTAASVRARPFASWR